MMIQHSLDGQWQLHTGEQTIEAKVPGSVLEAMLKAGLIDDPFVAENEYAARDLFEKDYLFEKEFAVEPALLEKQRVELVFEGLDTLAQVSLNGVNVLDANNMHRTWRVDVKKHLHLGENRLAVLFFSPNRFIAKAAQEDPEITYCATGCMPGNNFLRKAHYMFGWDWGPQLPDAGIFRPCRIEAYDEARIESVEILQHHDQSGVELEVSVQMDGPAPQNVRMQVVTPEGKILQGRQDGAVLRLRVDDPQLWYPNGWGNQPLYKVEITCIGTHGEVMDRTEKRIGLRTVGISREKDEWGSEFCFRINGHKLFAMGADYIPEDNLIGRTNEQRTRKLLEDCVKANYNCVRVWGGGYYPEDWFFDICDELGLLVWMDLMYACNVYRLTPEFENNIVQETRDNVKRIRHHASLALLCGNNEMEVAWCEWPKVTVHSPALKADYIKQFEYVLQGECLRLAPQVPFWKSSPSSGGSFDDPNSYEHGDVHCWDVWHGLQPFEEYRRKYPRFCSEFGFESFPGLKTVAAFAPREDWNVFSRTMESHQKCREGNGKILYYLAQNYQYPTSFEDTLYASQVLQAEAMRTAVEHWRRNRGRCMGAIYWQINDCWPVASWSSIDSEGRWKALHYAAKRFFAPVMASVENDGLRVRASVVNDTLNGFEGKLVFQIVDAHGTVVYRTDLPVSIPCTSAQWMLEKDLHEYADGTKLHPEDHLAVTVNLYDSKGVLVSQGCELMSRPKFFAFEKPSFSWNVVPDGNNCEIELTANCFAWGVWLDVKDADCLFSDNHFFVMPGETKRLTAYDIDCQTLREGLFIQSISNLNHADR